MGTQLVRFSTRANKTGLSFTGVEAGGALIRDVITIGDRSPKPCTDNDVLIKNYQTSPSLFFWTLSNYIAGRIQMKIFSWQLSENDWRDISMNKLKQSLEHQRLVYLLTCSNFTLVEHVIGKTFLEPEQPGIKELVYDCFDQLCWVRKYCVKWELAVWKELWNHFDVRYSILSFTTQSKCAMKCILRKIPVHD